MNLKKLTILIVACLIISSCGGDDENNTPMNVVIIEEDIDIPTTWLTNTVYIIRNYDFYVTSTLTIQPGVVIKFHPEDGPYLMLGGSGVIHAGGAADKPIVFTSYKDDSKKGDTNGNGSSSSPANGDWSGIYDNSLSIPSPYFYKWKNILYDSY